MYDWLIRHIFHRLWEFEESRLSPNWKGYSKGEVLDETAIEPGILNLVKTLNVPSLGLKTIASCQGHFFTSPYPYVFFQAPPSIASSLTSELFDLRHKLEPTALSFPWAIEPTFNIDFQVCYVLKLEGNPVRDHQSWPWMARQWRHELSKDMAYLATFCAQKIQKDHFSDVEAVPTKGEFQCR